MSPETKILLALALPSAGALLISLTGRWPNLRETVTLTTAALLFLVVLFLVPVIAAGGRPELVLLELFPGVPIRFEVLGDDGTVIDSGTARYG